MNNKSLKYNKKLKLNLFIFKTIIECCQSGCI